MGEVMIQFQWPYMICLLPLPWVIYLLWHFAGSKVNEQAPEIRFPHLRGLQAAFGPAKAAVKTKKRWWKYLLFATWAFLVLALMRPQTIDQVDISKSAGHDLMLAVDLSGSMQTLDFTDTVGNRVSRIDVAKKVVKEFVENRHGDRVGLILFGEHPYLQAPLTLDTMAVSRLLDNSLPGMAGDATAIGDAIGLAVKNLRDRPAASRAIILLTDGEDNSSTIPPLQAATLAQQYGIHIYTIVIGKDGIVPFPDGHGGLVMTESHVDSTLTRKIAEMTGGAFFTASDQKALEQIYHHIDALEKTEDETPPLLIRHSLYSYPMTGALALLGILSLMAVGKKETYEF